MKINMILPGINHSGGVQMAFDYLNYFVKKGADVICYTPLRTLVKTGINSDSLGKWYKANFKIRFVPFFNDITIRNADVTIATSWITSYWVSSLSSKKGKKIYFIQGYENWYSVEKNKKVRDSYHLPMDLRISVSTELKQKLKKLDNCDSKVICNGIKKRYIRSSKKELSNNNLINIGMPYREKTGAVDIKNCAFGIKVIQNLQEKNHNLRFKMYGFKKPKDLARNIDFLENPSREELMKWYDSVDILYIPSLYEGWGLPAMEGMARGCVVVASNTGCLKEFGEDRVNCITLSNMKDINQAKQAIQMLIDDKKMQKDLSRSAIATIKDYSFEKSANIFWGQLKNNVLPKNSIH